MNSSKQLKIKESKISGNGVFAGEDINKGETICSLAGESCSLDEILKRISEKKEVASDPLQTGHEQYIDLNGFSRTFNHSCSPNSFVRKISELVALADIKQGDEITFDYSTTMDDNEEKILIVAHRKPWLGKCNCKNINCREVIDQFKRLPQEVQKFYIKNKLMPDFMLKKFTLLVVGDPSQVIRD